MCVCVAIKTERVHRVNERRIHARFLMVYHIFTTPSGTPTSRETREKPMMGLCYFVDVCILYRIVYFDERAQLQQ